MANLVLGYLKNECQIDISKCRGQSYDNAANMSGRYRGMQQRIREQNPHAIFVPCAAHSLNLVGRAATDCCMEAVNFFCNLQNIYSFFSASTHRWSVLLSCLPMNALVVKSRSDMRWEADARATAAVISGYSDIIAALNSLYEDDKQKGEARRDAGNIAEKMQELEFVFLLELWNDILHRCP